MEDYDPGMVAVWDMSIWASNTQIKLCFSSTRKTVEQKTYLTVNLHDRKNYNERWTSKKLLRTPELRSFAVAAAYGARW